MASEECKCGDCSCDRAKFTQKLIADLQSILIMVSELGEAILSIDNVHPCLLEHYYEEQCIEKAIEAANHEKTEEKKNFADKFMAIMKKICDQ